MEVVAVVQRLRQQAGFPIRDSLRILGLPRSTYFDWSKTGGKSERPKPVLPKAHHITPEERAAVIAFARQHPEEGYRRLSYMMIRASVAAVRPSTVLRILQEANLIGRWKQTSRRPRHYSAEGQTSDRCRTIIRFTNPHRPGGSTDALQLLIHSSTYERQD